MWLKILYRRFNYYIMCRCLGHKWLKYKGVSAPLEGGYMKALARAVERAAQIREESFDHDAYNQASSTGKGVLISDNFYHASLLDACNQAAEEAGFDVRGTELIYLLLTYSWNDALGWAKIMKS